MDMTKEIIETLKDINNAPEVLRVLCRKDRQLRGKTNWNYMSTESVQTGQLIRFLNKDEGISTNTLMLIAKWLIDNN